MIRVSVATPTRDRAAFIEAAIDGASQQSLPAYEHIVIDGDSRDDTLLRLSRYPGLNIVSEPDQGLYDAINKGIRRAQGDVICLLKSDDRLSAAIEEVRRVAALSHRRAVSFRFGVGLLRQSRLHPDLQDHDFPRDRSPRYLIAAA